MHQTTMPQHPLEPLTGWGAWGFRFPALPAVCWGLLAGSVVQTFQPALWPSWVYPACFAMACAILAVVALGRWYAVTPSLITQKRYLSNPKFAASRRWALWLAAAVIGAVMAFAIAGWRATAFKAQALSPQLEGVDIRLTGVVAAMPQVTASGVRFRLAVEAAEFASPPAIQQRSATSGNITLPPVVDVAWYRSALYGQSRVSQAPPPTKTVLQPDSLPDTLPTAAEPVIRAGDRWSLTVRLKAPHGLVNPHGFDYELWMWEQGVQAQGYVRAGAKDQPPQYGGRTWQYPVEQWRQSVRDAIFARLLSSDVLLAMPPVASREALQASLEADEPITDDSQRLHAAQRIAGVVAALVTGDQRAIERPDWDIFRATGVAHLMSISGLHITLFAWLAALVVRAVWRRSIRCCLFVPAATAGLWIGFLLALLYAIFSGFGVPAQRTVLMLGVFAVLRFSGQRWPWPMVWLLAATVVVVWDPWAVWQAGFWLSFVAVGVLFATDIGAKKPINKSGKGYFLSLLREQWVVTLALTPLSLLLFGQVAVASFLANLLAIPWVTLVVTPLALAGIAVPPLWQASAWALQPLVLFLQWLAAWPGAVLWLPVAPIGLGILAVLGGVVMAMRWSWRWRLLGLPLALPALLWQPSRPPHGQFDLLAADIGQGNAVVLRTAQHSLLYDTGPQFGIDSDAGDRVLNPLLRAMGERLDKVVLSHRDSDHTGGAAAVLLQQPQATVLGSLEPHHPLRKLRAVEPCVAGQSWVWDGVTFTVLHPDASAVAALAGHAAPESADVPPSHAPHDSSSATAVQGVKQSIKISPNSMSCVLRVQAADIHTPASNNRAVDYTATAAPTTALPDQHIHVHQGGAVALLVGDIEAPQERSLLAQNPQDLRADWLLVPHHGSKTSSTTAFVAAVHPRIAVVQAGYRNRFGHPAPVVQQRYVDQGVRLVSSPFCGASQWASTAPDTVHCQRQTAMRYWRHSAIAASDQPDTLMPTPVQSLQPTD